MRAEVERRKRTGEKFPPLFFVVDEFNAVMRMGGELAEELSTLLLEISQEGRKYGVFALLIAQIWTKKGIGDADIRQSCASAIVHRTSKTQAELLLDDPEHARAVTKLEPGVAMFLDTNGYIHELRTPFTTEQDGHLVGRLLASGVVESTAKLARINYEISLTDEVVINPAIASESERTDTANQRRLRSGSQFTACSRIRGRWYGEERNNAKDMGCQPLA
jgi:DNA segregation ATPase FtsK/SpoIIIE-like protein